MPNPQLAQFRQRLAARPPQHMEGVMTNVIQLKRVRKEHRKDPHPAEDLSFMKRRKPRGSGTNYWNVDPTGHWSADYETGKELAREYLTYRGRYPTGGNATLLGCIVNDMVKRVGNDSRLDGVAVGFLSVVNEAALLTAAYLPQAVRS